MYKIGYVKDGYVTMFYNDVQMMLIERLFEDDSYNVVFKDETGNDMDIHNVHNFETAAQYVIDEINTYFKYMQDHMV